MYKLGEYRKKKKNIKIDFVIQKSMYETEKDKWNTILEVQSRLYEEFEIDG